MNANNRSQKRLHQYMYQEYYWNDITDEQREMNRVHNGELPRNSPEFIG